VIANAHPIVESFTLHPNSVISILCSWIHDVTPFSICCSKYLARKLQSEAGDLYWKSRDHLWSKYATILLIIDALQSLSY